MKRPLQLFALAAVLTLAFIAGMSRPAYATPTCASLALKPCSPNGTSVSCLPGGGYLDRCVCTFQHWVCTK